MATREAVVNVKVNAPKTLGQLESELEGINQELKQVAPNSKAFKDLSKQAQQASKEIGNLGAEIEGSVGTKQAEKAKLVGEGLVGGFAAATSAAALFGAESSEALAKAQARAVLLFTAVDGIDKAYKALPATVTNSIGTMIKGFGKAIKSAKLFGTTTRAAMTATGIGILLVAVGLLIANWEKVTDAVTEFKDEIITALKFIAPPLGFLIEAVDGLIEKFGSFSAVIGGVVEATKALFRFEWGEIGEAFEEGAKAAQDLVEAEDKLKEFQDKKTKEYDRQIRLLESIEGTEKEVYDLKKKQLEEEIKLRIAVNEKNKGNKKAYEEEAAAIQDLITDAQVLANNEKKRTDAKADATEKEKKAQDEILKKEKLKTDELIKQNALIQEQIGYINNLLGGSNDVALAFSTAFESFQTGTGTAEEFVKTIGQLTVDANALKSALDFQNEVQANEKALEALKPRAYELLGIQEQRKLTADEELEKNKLILAIKEKTIDINNTTIALIKKKAAIEKEELKLIEEIGDEVEKEIQDQLDAELDAIVKKEQAEEEAALAAFERRQAYIDKLKEAEALAQEERVQNLEDLYFTIESFGRAMDLGFEAAFVNLNNQLIEFDKEFAASQKALDDFYDNALDYNKLLEDANGDRFKALEIAQEQQAEKESVLQNANIDAQNKIIDAENEQAKIAKAQAVIQSIVQTALSVTAALASIPPNVPLSIINGIIGAGATATIASQKVPLQEKLPPFADGGFTESGGKYDAKGVVHANEFVASQATLSTPEGLAMAMAMDTMNKNLAGFADGGFTSPPDPATADLASVNTFSNEPIYVSVTEIRDVGRNVDVLETKSSL